MKNRSPEPVHIMKARVIKPRIRGEPVEGSDMFQPWIGSQYADTRLLILGASAYSWWENDELQDPSPQHSVEMVRWATETFPNCGRFFGMVSRALARKETPDRDCLKILWDRVAFTNYVSVTVGDGPRIATTATMWEAAKRDFLPEITKRLTQPLFASSSLEKRCGAICPTRIFS
jgi:hypothetical protein